MPTPFEISDSLAKSQLGAFEFFTRQVSAGMEAESRAISYQATVANQLSQSAADYLKTEQDAWRLDQQNQREIERLSLEKKRLEAYQEADDERRLDKDRQLRLGERQKGITALGLNLNRQHAPLVAELGKIQAERKAAAERMSTPSGMAAALFDGVSGLEEFDARAETITSKINTIQSQREALIQLNALIAAGVDPGDDMMQGFGVTQESSLPTSDAERVRLEAAEKANQNPLTPPSDSPYNPSLFPSKEVGTMAEPPPPPKPESYPGEIPPTPSTSPAPPPTPGVIPEYIEKKVSSSVDPLVSSIADSIYANPKEAPEALRHLDITESFFKNKGEGFLKQFQSTLQKKREEILSQYEGIVMEDVIFKVADPLSDGSNMPITKYEPSESVKRLEAAALATRMNPVELERKRNLLFARGRSFIARETKANNGEFDFFDDYEGNMTKFQNFVNPPVAKEKESATVTPEAPVKTRSTGYTYIPARNIGKIIEGDEATYKGESVAKSTPEQKEEIYAARRYNAANALMGLGYAKDHPYVIKALHDKLQGEGLDKLVDKARLEKAGGTRPEDPTDPLFEKLGSKPIVENFAKLSKEDQYQLAYSIALSYKDKISKLNETQSLHSGFGEPMALTMPTEEAVKELESITPKDKETSTSALWAFIKKYK